MTDNTLYYFYSTCAQAVGAIVGLLGALLIFRYQGVLAEIDIRAEMISKTFQPGGTIGSGFFSKTSRSTYRDFTSHRQRIDWLRAAFGRFWKSNDSSELEANFRENVEYKTHDLDAIVARRVEELRGWRLEFEHLDRQICAASKTRLLAIGVTVAGLFVVALGIAGIVTREIVPAESSIRVCLASIYGTMVLLYLLVVGVSIREAFRLPL